MKGDCKAPGTISMVHGAWAKIPGQSNGGIKGAWLPGRRATSLSTAAAPAESETSQHQQTRTLQPFSFRSFISRKNWDEARTTDPAGAGRIYFRSFTVSSARCSPSPSLSPPASIHQTCNPVVFAGRIRMCPWQPKKGKSTGIKFQRNCLLNCGLQLLKFYPRFCVTAAVMNSAWLWFAHSWHAASEVGSEPGCAEIRNSTERLKGSHCGMKHALLN